MKAAALFICLLATQVAQAVELRSGSFTPPRQAPEFSLRGSDGADLKLSKYRGKVVALGFGYTNCPDVCPTTLAILARARKSLGAAGEDFQVLYVTVDPERDSVERLREFVSAFDPSFLGVTGNASQLAEVQRAYGVLVTRQNIPGKPRSYYAHHSTSVYLIDRDGALRAMIPFGTPLEDVTHDVGALLGRRP